jgi:hypothetical protein
MRSRGKSFVYSATDKSILRMQYASSFVCPDSQLCVLVRKLFEDRTIGFARFALQNRKATRCPVEGHVRRLYNCHFAQDDPINV